eukprot:TRINITY_DN59238_c0_g1_i1.p1 TRINITY_DN59238_c0_g1~~TRINITY_DN59238_c0_g1_i1.p1  ORF type:complete len:119 (+),score=8.88 TRINITY_DN59238_c0_g1_i1:38-394(+)
MARCILILALLALAAGSRKEDTIDPSATDSFSYVKSWFDRGAWTAYRQKNKAVREAREQHRQSANMDCPFSQFKRACVCNACPTEQCKCLAGASSFFEGTCTEDTTSTEGTIYFCEKR